MKNVFKVLGIIAIVAVIGFSMAACGSDDDNGGGKDALDGTSWKINNGALIKFKSPNFTLGLADGTVMETGTYSITGENMSFTNSSGSTIYGYKVILTYVSGTKNFDGPAVLSGNKMYLGDGSFVATKQ
jgi:hypothetical protein